MKKSKLLIAGLCAAMVLSSVSALAADDTPMPIAPAPDLAVSQGLYELEVDGRQTDINICITVPLRPVAEALGFKVIWNNDGTITLDDGTMNSTITMGEDLYQVVTSKEDLAGMSAPFSLGMAPYSVNGTTYVPLELFNALLGNAADIRFVNGKLSISTQPTQPDNVQVLNPFVDCASLKEAEKIAGFALAVPKTPDAVQAVEKDMIQALYGEDGSDMVIRKAAGSGDISGDYSEYAQVKTVDGVTLKGKNGTFSLAIWERDGYTYSINVDKALAQADMMALAAAVA